MAFLARVPERPEIRSLGNVYKSISDEIIALLFSVDLLNYKETKAQAIRKKVDAYIRRLNLLASKHTRKYIPEAYNKARDRSEVSLRGLGRKELREPFTEYPTHAASIQNRITQARDTLITANGTIRKTVENYLLLTKQLAGSLMQLQEFGGGVLSEEDQVFLLDQVSKAIEKGLSRQTMSARLRDFIQHRVGDGQLIEVKGRYYKINKYAEMVARTEMRNSQSDAVKTSCERYGNDLVEVSNHGTETEICKQYEGEVFSISGTDPNHAALEESPPFHPNCQHFLIPTSEEAIAFGY